MADEEQVPKNENIQHLPADECESVFSAFAECMVEALPEGVRMIIVLTREHDGLTVQHGNVSMKTGLDIFRHAVTAMEAKLGATDDVQDQTDPG